MNRIVSISVIIATRSRPDKIGDCLKSILANSFSDFEIIVIDQSAGNKTKGMVQKINTPKLKYLKMKASGKAKALNLALKKLSGKLLAFTDDDCIVDKNWLKNIYLSFEKNKEISAVFGKVLPYRPKYHKGKTCPCTFLKDKKKIITKACLHWKNIGFGNNMAFRGDVFEKVGRFKEWLGPGSVGLAAVDAEFTLRVLLKGYKLLYNPRINVYHNRWLTRKEDRRQSLSYSCGEVACYGYFAFQGKKLGKRVLKNNFLDSLDKLKFGIKSILLFKKNSLQLLCHAFQEFYFRLRGLTVAFWFRS